MVNAAAIDAALHRATAAREVAGAVAMATTASDTIYQACFGTADLATGAPLRPDSIFRYASMTKAITSVAAMQLVERGKLALDAPIAAVLPHLAAPMVLEGFQGPMPALRPAARPITLRHLLTHTSGLGYDVWNADLKRATDALGLPGRPTSVDELARFPLLFDPGARWNYSISTDVVGHAVEAASGMRLDAYLAAHVTGPLGMADTTFTLSDAQRPRLVAVHQRQADGSLGAGQRPAGNGPGFLAGGGGLVGTAGDYLRFLRMLLRGGTLDGARLLAPETVAEMARNQIGEKRVLPMVSAVPTSSYDCDFFPGMEQKWGLGFLINTQRGPNGRNAGSLAWAGLVNTYFWIDPTAGIAAVLLTQSMPFADPKALALLAALERGLYDLD
jgi:CubicO group peptidase (beta-lactamase class C family)